MRRHRNPRPKVPKHAAPDNLTYGAVIRRLYAVAVELEALTVSAEEAAGTLPPTSSVKHRQLYARIATLAGRIADQASFTLERAEELVTLHMANLRGQTVKRS